MWENAVVVVKKSALAGPSIIIFTIDACYYETLTEIETTTKNGLLNHFYELLAAWFLA